MAKKKAAPVAKADAPLDPVLAALANPEVSDAPVSVPGDDPADGAPELGGADLGAPGSDPVSDLDEDEDDGSTGYGANAPQVETTPVLLNSPDTVVNILAAPNAAPVASEAPLVEDVYPQPEEAQAAPPASGVPANPALLEWPSDQYGTTSGIKQPLLDCIGRLNGAPEKLEVFLLTIKMATDHAIARFEEQRKEAQHSLNWHLEQEARRNAGRNQTGWQS